MHQFGKTQFATSTVVFLGALACILVCRSGDWQPDRPVRTAEDYLRMMKYSGSFDIPQITKDTAVSEPLVVEFVATFSDARHVILGIATETPEWTSEILLHGRYVFLMTFGLEADPTARSGYVRASAPTFVFSDIGTTRRLDDGRLMIEGVGPLHGTTVSQQQWSIVVETGGDFGAVGIQLDKENPNQDLIRDYMSVDFFGET